MKKSTRTNPFKFLVLLLSLSLLGACGSSPHAAQPNERQAKAIAMWQERCKTAGEKIYKTVENVEGIYLMKIRPSEVNFGDQFKMDDPYGSDFGGETYILNFLRGFHHQSNVEPFLGSPPRVGYLYVYARDPRDGLHRYTGGKKVTGRMDPTAPNVLVDLKRDPNFDLNIYRFVLDRVPAPGKPPRYGVTYDDISTREEREYWIAGSSLKVIDLQTNEVIAERIGYMVDWAQGSQTGGRSPWLLAANQACPGFQRNPLKPMPPGRGSSAQISQTIDFVEKVLKPSK